MTKQERAEKYRRDIADFEARQSILNDFAEQGVWCAIGALEEYLSDPADETLELPPRHKNKARAMVKRMKEWADQIEQDTDRIYQRQEVVEDKLFTLTEGND